MNERVFLPAVSGDASKYCSGEVRTFLLLDLDGVFVPESYSTAPKEWFPVTRNAGVLYPNRYYNKELNFRLPRHAREPKKFELRWSAELVKKLSNVVSSPNIQTVWVTTWRSDMGGVSEAMKLNYHHPAFYLPWGEDVRGEPHSGKLPAVDSFLNSSILSEDVKVAWLDDKALKDLTPASNIFKQLSERNVLLIKPNSKHGVSRSEWSTVESFVS